MSRTHKFATDETVVLVSDEEIKLCFDDEKVLIRGDAKSIFRICRSMALQAGVRLHWDEHERIFAEREAEKAAPTDSREAYVAAELPTS